MPSYNTGCYIADSIKSVLGQTYSNWELIIVDDCSSDNTEEIVRSFLPDERIKYFKNPRNSGAAISRNVALSKAQGKWIAFLDSDDLWNPEKLSKQIAFMKKNSYSFSYTNYIEIDECGTANGKLITGPKRIGKKGFYNYCWPGCLTVMYDQDIVGLIQVEDIKKNNDYAMWLEVCRKADCYLLPEVLAYYRRGRNGSISSNSLMNKIKWHYNLHKYALHKNAVEALVNTIRNLLFGLLKFIFYVKSY